MTIKQAKANLDRVQLNAEKAWNRVSILKRELAVAEAAAKIEDIKLECAKTQLKNIILNEE